MRVAFFFTNHAGTALIMPNIISTAAVGLPAEEKATPQPQEASANCFHDFALPL
jgi:hypothetical protein